MSKPEFYNAVGGTSPCEILKRPSIQEQCLSNIKHLAANITQEQKRLEFCKLFPSACKYIEENELNLSC